VPDVGCGHGFDEAGGDELAECGFGDADETADFDEADASFGDQPAGEAFGGLE
jgi:hypothetical protein